MKIGCNYPYCGCSPTKKCRVDFGKPLRTKDQREAEVINKTENTHGIFYSVLVKSSEDKGNIYTYRADGYPYPYSSSNLILENYIKEPKMEKKLDFSKRVQTRDGRKARIICINRKHETHPIAALITPNEDSREVVYYYRPNGKVFDHSRGMDLINIPQKKSGFMNIWTSGEGHVGQTIYPTWEAAITSYGRGPIFGTVYEAIAIPVEWEVGQNME